MQCFAVQLHHMTATYCLQKEVTAVLLEGDKGGQQLEGVAMKGIIARRFEELDWDNNGELSAREVVLLCCRPRCTQ